MTHYRKQQLEMHKFIPSYQCSTYLYGLSDKALALGTGAELIQHNTIALSLLFFYFSSSFCDFLLLCLTSRLLNSTFLISDLSRKLTREKQTEEQINGSTGKIDLLSLKNPDNDARNGMPGVFCHKNWHLCQTGL